MTDYMLMTSGTEAVYLSPKGNPIMHIKLKTVNGIPVRRSEVWVTPMKKEDIFNSFLTHTFYEND